MKINPQSVKKNRRQRRELRGERRPGTKKDNWNEKKRAQEDEGLVKVEGKGRGRAPKHSL